LITAGLGALPGEQRFALAFLARPNPSAFSSAQQAKSWELRTAMSMARLWRDQDKRMKPPICSRRSMVGSPKDSIRSI
jgi:hypothetical protein